MKENIFEPILKFLTNRLLFLVVLVFAVFYILVSQLFRIQIVEGHTHLETLSDTIAREVPVAAQRGNIYDRYGRPLATNRFVYSVFIDPSIKMTDGEINQVIYNLTLLLSKYGEEYIDDLPITVERPYEFTFYGENPDAKKVKWIAADMGLIDGDDVKTKKEIDEAAADMKDEDIINVLAKEMTAEEAFVRLKEKFAVDAAMPDYAVRAIVAIRTKMWLIRYYSYNPIMLSENLSLETITRIEEDPEKFKGLDTAKDAVRVYPQGKYMSHVVGHVGRISAEEYETLANAGYNPDDIIGKAGIESVFEDKLRGRAGEATVIVDTAGRKVSEMDNGRVEPVQGDKIFLTMDSEFQKTCFNILEETLRDVIINKITSSDPKAIKITAKELLTKLVLGNNIKSRIFFNAKEGTYSYLMKSYVLGIDPSADPSTREGRIAINTIIAEGIEGDSVPLMNLIMLLIEQGTFTVDDNYLSRIQNGAISVYQIILDKLRDGELTPQMANVDPSTGSLVVVDVQTGDILACPTYPTYDTNEYNSNYINLSEDTTIPLYNRPFMEQRPPGSTFKMISAVTALEYGSITKNTTIYDEVTFTKAGRPEPSCWNKNGHGSINIIQAIEGSCNYFFFEAIYRIGNQRSGNGMDSIAALNKYMSLFGLDEPSGVEIGELNKSRGKSPLNISSPEFKEYLYKDSDTESTEWFDGNTIHTAMGQGFSSYTPSVMARYINTIANRGKKYDLHLLKKIVAQNEVLEYVPKYTNIGSEVSENTWDIVYEGMYQVIEGSTGTGRNIFTDFPIEIAGKTGTAEELKGLRPDHTSFGGFAPYDNPEIAVYVMLPFSDTTTTASPSTQAARKVMEAYFKLDAETGVTMHSNAIIG